MTTITQQQASWFADTFRTLVANVEQAVLGKTHTVRLAFTCLLSEGHLLIEDNPGTGKTVLAKAVANTIRSTNSRIQFTPDLLPSDVTGVNIWDQDIRKFRFHPGPIFASVVLADEINRASPKTQSALLEVMEENQVTVDGEARPVPAPFMVIATQNPIEQAGTYRLPEAQLDRFLMKTHLGYPDHATAVTLLADASNRHRSTAVGPVIQPSTVAELVRIASTVHVDPAVLAYVSRIAEETRPGRADGVRLGLSMRGALNYVRAAKAWAASEGRTWVSPGDIKTLAEPLLVHRILLEPEAEFAGATVHGVISRVLASIEPPTDRVA